MPGDRIFKKLRERVALIPLPFYFLFIIFSFGEQAICERKRVPKIMLRFYILFKIFFFGEQSICKSERVAFIMLPFYFLFIIIPLPNKLFVK
jgi:hypothetical protein